MTLDTLLNWDRETALAAAPRFTFLHPNWITTISLCLAFVGLTALFYGGNWALGVAGAFLVFASRWTDWIDGYVARATHRSSNLGGLYDIAVGYVTMVTVMIAIGAREDDMLLAWTGAASAIVLRIVLMLFGWLLSRRQRLDIVQWNPQKILIARQPVCMRRVKWVLDFLPDRLLDRRLRVGGWHRSSDLGLDIYRRRPSPDRLGYYRLIDLRRPRLAGCASENGRHSKQSGSLLTMEKKLYMRRHFTTPGSPEEQFCHRLTVEDQQIRVQIWWCRAHYENGLDVPGDRNFGSMIWGGDLDLRLENYVFTEASDFTVDWDQAKMGTEGNVCLFYVDHMGLDPGPTYRTLEIDELAGMCDTGTRIQSNYPHWDHKRFVLFYHFHQFVFDNLNQTLFPYLRTMSFGSDIDGFLHPDLRLEGQCNDIGFIGDFDHKAEGNSVAFRDPRPYFEPNKDPNPDYDPTLAPQPSPMPADWEFG